MLNKLTSKFFGSSNERQIKKYKPIIDQINNLEDEFSNLSDNELKLKTKLFKDLSPLKTMLLLMVLALLQKLFYTHKILVQGQPVESIH